MSSEKRLYERGQVTLDEQGIVIYLKTADGLFAVTRILDMSLTGAGVETRYAVERGERVVLRYQQRELDLSIEGTVARCIEGDDDHCAIGIAFDEENRDKNALFFLALRQYLADDASRQP